jgi:hypothetical protein
VVRHRDILEGVIAVGQSIPVMREDDRPLWRRINQSLNDMAAAGQKLFNMKAMTRQDVLLNLDQRLKNLDKYDGKPN